MVEVRQTQIKPCIVEQGVVLGNVRLLFSLIGRYRAHIYVSQSLHNIWFGPIELPSFLRACLRICPKQSSDQQPIKPIVPSVSKDTVLSHRILRSP